MDNYIEEYYIRPDEVEDYDDDDFSYDAILESSAANLQIGYIYGCKGFPFYEKSRGGSSVIKRRPVLILDGPYGGIKAYMIGSIHEDTPTKKFVKHLLKTNQELYDWKEEGLHKRSYVAGLVYRDVADLKLKPYPYGKISDNDLKQLREKLKFSKENWHLNPFSTLDWLKSNKVQWTTHSSGNNNMNRLQTYKEIERSKTANCVDIATLAHHAADAMDLENCIVQTQYIKSGQWYGPGHLYCCFKIKNRDTNEIVWKVFHFIPDPIDAKILTYSDDLDKSIEQFVRTELNPEFSTRYTLVTAHTQFIEDNLLSLWDYLVEKRAIQKDLVNIIQFVYAIKWLNSVLIKYDWAQVVNGKKLPDGKWDEKNYRTLDPKTFELLRAGCCWDYVVYEQEWFKKYFPFIKTHLYYAEGGINGHAYQTHTWISFEIPYDPCVYVFEASFKKYTGIHKFAKNPDSGFSAMKDSVIYWFINIFPNPNYTGVVYEVTKPVRKGMNTEEFMGHCIRNGKIVYKKGDYLEKFIQPFIDNNYKFTES